MKARLALQSICMATSLVAAMPSQAARSFTPQPGTWVVTSELDGKPGRGLAIDVQGNAFLMQVFAYEESGAPTFYTAMGTLDGNTVTAPLIRYVGGRSFGSEPRSADVRAIPGNVVLRFTDGLNGVVQFPGEPELAIQRFVVMDQAYESRYVKGPTVSPRSFRMVGLDGGNQPVIGWDAELITAAAGRRQLLLTRTTATTIVPQQVMDCSIRNAVDAYDCTAQAGGAAAPSDVLVRSASIRITGPDVQGEAETSGTLAGRWSLQGEVKAGGSISAWGACSDGAYTYMQDTACYSGDVQVPANGTWMVTDEINGKPGRGIAVDVQNGLAIAQVFNYSNNGGTTFHMGSTPYSEQVARLPLQRYQGGRAVGGPMQSATWLDSPGDMILGFHWLDDRTKRGTRTVGVVQFPNEKPKSMVRLVLESQTTLMERLGGQWLLHFQPSGGEPGAEIAQVVSLTQDRGAVVSNADGSVQCESVQAVAASFDVACNWLAEAGKGAMLGTARFVLQPNNRSTPAMRIRDRHGNLVGLGVWQ